MAPARNEEWRSGGLRYVCPRCRAIGLYSDPTGPEYNFIYVAERRNVLVQSSRRVTYMTPANAVKISNDPISKE